MLDIPKAQTFTLGKPKSLYDIFDAGISAANENQFEKATELFRQVVGKRPAFVAARVNLASMLWTQHKADEAIVQLHEALKLDPLLAQAHMDLGVFCAEQGNLDDAVIHLRRAVAIEPSGMGYMNLAGVYRRMGKRQQALRAYEAAVAFDPDDPYYRLNRGMEYLLFGRYEDGWRDFACRIKLDYGHSKLPIAKDTRIWDGGHVEHLVIHYEQGIGDTIMAARYLNAASQKVDRLTFVPQEGLGSLMAYSFKDNPKITVQETVPEQYDTYQWLDMLLSPAGVEPIPTTPYLFAPETNRWRHLQKLPGLKVGLVWAGRMEQVVDKRRTMPFEYAHKLFAVPGVSFVSLQKDRTETHPQLYDIAPYLKDWKATATAMNALDLIISVDTSTVHMAGALGRPVWLLNRFDTCWRWQLEREDSPWYPTMRIFRQPRSGDWGSMIDGVCAALNDFSKKSGHINLDTK